MLVASMDTTHPTTSGRSRSNSTNSSRNTSSRACHHQLIQQARRHDSKAVTSSITKAGTQRRRFFRKRRPRQVLNGPGGTYEILRTLGRGSTAIAKLAVHKESGESVAIKMMTHRDLYKLQMTEQVRREIEALSKLNHPNVLRLYEVLENPKEMYIVTELADQDLFDYIVARGRLSEKESQLFFQQMMCGLEHCHEHRIAHRDVKPENLLITRDGRLLIADFGLSGVIKDGELLNESCGSYNYAAPEIILSRPYAGPEVDIWSAGVVLYVMLTGKVPFGERKRTATECRSHISLK